MLGLSHLYREDQSCRPPRGRTRAFSPLAEPALGQKRRESEGAGHRDANPATLRVGP